MRCAPRAWRTQVLSGAQALCDMAADPEVDSVMAAIVGAAGLPPCLAAARAGKRLLLANKEALVVGGALFMRAVKEGGATLLPIDSEHSAIFQCLPQQREPVARHHRPHRAHRLGRAFPHARPGHAGQRHARRGLRPPQLGDGPQDLGRFGDDDEQGARGHRGALALRPAARADPGGDPPAEHHPFDGGVPRRLRAGAAGHARHARADQLRTVVSAAHRIGRGAAGLHGACRR